MNIVITEHKIHFNDTTYVPKLDNPRIEIPMEYNIGFLIQGSEVSFDGLDTEFWDTGIEDIFEIAKYLHDMIADEIKRDIEYDDNDKPYHPRDDKCWQPKSSWQRKREQCDRMHSEAEQ